MVKKNIAFALMLITSGCAIMDQGSWDAVKIIATPENAQRTTKCVAYNEEGRWENIRPLQIFYVERDGNPLTIECEHDDLYDKKTIAPMFNSRYLINDLLLGFCLISCTIDAATNSFYDYPDFIFVDLVKRH